MIKLLRNHLIDDGVKLEDGTIINRATLEKIVRVNEFELKLCPKLSFSLLNLTGSQRMKVKPAAQLLSAHTAAICKHLFRDNLKIAQFFDTMNDIFDLFNSRCPDPLGAKCKAFGLDIVGQQSLLERGKQMMSSMRLLTAKKDSRKSLIWFQKGYLVFFGSLMGLYFDLKARYDVSYILTARLTQDALENIFSRIRAMCSQSSNPTPFEVKNRIKLLLLGATLSIPKGANVDLGLDDSYMCTALLCKNSKQVSMPEFNSEPSVSVDSVDDIIDEVVKMCSNNFESNEVCQVGCLIIKDEAIKYLAGFLAFKLRKKLKNYELGQPSEQYLKLNPEIQTNDSWILTVSRGGLIVPSESILSDVKLLESSFHTNFEKFKNLESVSYNLIRCLQLCHEGIDEFLVKEFVNLRIKIRLKHINELARTARKKKSQEIARIKKAKMFVNSSK